MIKHDHPWPRRATQGEVGRHPELRYGQLITRDRQPVWMSSLTNMVACCPESVCELVERTVGMTWPIMHPPGFDCHSHEATT